MSSSAAETLPQDTDSSESLPVPNGWILQQRRTRDVEQMFKEYTGLNATLELTSKRGTTYIFSSGNDYYVWNCECEDGWRILNANSREELYSHLTDGKVGLKLEMLPDFGDLEG